MTPEEIANNFTAAEIGAALEILEMLR